MNENEKFIEEMKSLTEQINRANYAYYVLDEPIMSDKEWDALYYRLLDLEKLTGTVLPDSPSKRVGGEVLAGFKKVTHAHKLYSLAKAQTSGELVDWNTRNHNLANFEEEFSVEYKFDGLSLCITYDDGKLVRAATRGNGDIGEDVTEQVKTIKTVPLSIKYKGLIDVQGEGIIKLTELEKYNETTDEKLKNARNAVAGAIRNLDPKVTAKRNLDFFAYNVNYCPDKRFESQTEINEFLKEQGFMTGGFFTIAHSIEEIYQIVENVGKTRDKLNFLIDGMVIKINSTKVRDDLGYTEKTPRWAVAYKFEAEETSTILRDITWQVGRTGKITPVAELEPTDLCGVTIKRATLNNFNDINRKKVKLGDKVFIRRSNDVIPEILSVAETYPHSKTIEKPETCPCCGSVLEDTGTELYCTNHLGCRTQIVLKLQQFSSRNAMNIDGLSVKTLEKLYDRFGIKSFSDIYKITAKELAEIEGFKDKKISNILSSIKKSRQVKLANFIFALGIDNIGIKMAKQLAGHYKTIEALLSTTVPELVELDDIAETTAEGIYHYISEPETKQEIIDLVTGEVKIEKVEEKIVRGGVFDGKKVLVTGTLSKYSREQAHELIESLGGRTVTSVSGQTDILVVGENPGSKLEKAKNLGIRIMYEPEFIEITENK